MSPNSVAPRFQVHLKNFYQTSVTDVWDGLCWWRLWDFGDRFEMLVIKCFCHRRLQTATIITLSPTCNGLTSTFIAFMLQKSFILIAMMPIGCILPAKNFTNHIKFTIKHTVIELFVHVLETLIAETMHSNCNKEFIIDTLWIIQFFYVKPPIFYPLLDAFEPLPMTKKIIRIDSTIFEFKLR